MNDDIDEQFYQFIEVKNSHDETLGIINNNNLIKEFTQNLNIESWKYIDELPKEAKLEHIYITYEIVDDPIFLKNNTPFINKSSLKIYSYNNNYFLNDGSGSWIEVPKQVGKFLTAPTDIKMVTNITAEEILKEWDMDILESEEDNNIEMDYTANNGYYIGETHFDERNMLKVSEEHKLQFYDSNKKNILFETNDISIIVSFLNDLALGEWKYIDKIPLESEILHHITYYQLQRRTSEKKLVEVHTQVLYEDQQNYYIKEIVPDDDKSMELYYVIPIETAQIIIKFIENN